MNKIVLFAVFIPLLFLSIYLGFTQNANRKTNKNANISTNINTNSEANSNTNNNTALDSTINTNISVAPTAPIAVSQINLVISSPDSGITINDSTVVVSGKTKSSISVVVNDQEITSSLDGSFKVTVSLDEGDNYISIVAYDEEGNVTEREIIVTRTTSDI